jgi:hypothetical protein
MLAGETLSSMGTLTSSQLLPLLAMFCWPPHTSMQVFMLAAHQSERKLGGFTALGETEQQGMGVWNVALF